MVLGFWSLRLDVVSRLSGTCVGPSGFCFLPFGLLRYICASSVLIPARVGCFPLQGICSTSPSSGNQVDGLPLGVALDYGVYYDMEIVRSFEV